MATGTGKTTVMALLIIYHLLNRKNYPSDTRFADLFLVIAPNITIKDRLQEITHNAKDRKNVYAERSLIPHHLIPQVQDLSSKVFVTNYHSFLPKNLSGNKQGVFDNRTSYTDPKKKKVVKKSFTQLLKELLPKSFKFDKRLVVINDEAHHCYLPIGKGRNTEDGNLGKDENERASVWINAIAELKTRFKLQNVYDLSATPYYLLGSGYNEGQLFGWVISDFSLVEAIESGLVKIPYLPDLDNEKQKLSNLKDIYKDTRGELPNRANAKQINQTEAPPIPTRVKDALKMFYDHYDQSYNNFNNLFQINPVMIIVCANTTLSNEIYRYVAGWELQRENQDNILYKGEFEKFSNINQQQTQYHQKPRTLLIDSKALEDAKTVIDKEFKKKFKTELDKFYIEYAHRYGSGKKPNEDEILREVLNTVGKPGKLGQSIHCVISVAMLTEGWDANTVTHIFGLRAFGSQLLCEQVIGRALRRKNYYLAKYDEATNEQLLQKSKRTKGIIEKYPDEYAYIVGIPFEFVGKGRKTTITINPPKHTQIFAMKEREKQYQIVFPQVLSYQIEDLNEEVLPNLENGSNFIIDEKHRIVKENLTTSIGDQTETLDLESLKNMRHQAVIFKLTAEFLAKYHVNKAKARYYKFEQIKKTIETWYYEKIELKGNDVFRQLIYNDIPHAIEEINRIILINQIQNSKILPVLNNYQPLGYTSYVQGITTKEVFQTTKSHINYVVKDSHWEEIAAQKLEDMIEVERYVKNEFLGFKIPYISDKYEPRNYLPDFIVQVKHPKKQNELANIIVEVTGSNIDNKPQKADYTKNYWIKSINEVRHKFQENPYEWYFKEITNIDAFEGLLRNFINSEIK